MLMLTYCNTHTFIFRNLVLSERRVKKIPHFLGIVDVYKQLVHYENPKLFKVEPKYGKEYMEPDAFTIWRRSPFFIEVQKSVYSKKDNAR